MVSDNAAMAMNSCNLFFLWHGVVHIEQQQQVMPKQEPKDVNEDAAHAMRLVRKVVREDGSVKMTELGRNILVAAIMYVMAPTPPAGGRVA